MAAMSELYIKSSQPFKDFIFVPVDAKLSRSLGVNDREKSPWSCLSIQSRNCFIDIISKMVQVFQIVSIKNTRKKG